MDYCFYLEWRGLTSAEWAAWVQAIGSLLAIAATWRLARRDERRAAKLRAAHALEQKELLESQARSLALVIHGDLISLVSRLESFADKVDEFDKNQLVRAAFESNNAVLDPVRATSWQLGQPSKPLQLLIAALDTIKAARDDLAAKRDHELSKTSEWMLRKTIKNAAEVGREALNAMNFLMVKAADYPWSARP